MRINITPTSRARRRIFRGFRVLLHLLFVTSALFLLSQCLAVNAATARNRKTVGVFRPSNGTFYLRNSNTGGVADISLVFGNAGDQPIAGDWNGDGIDTLGIYRNGVFYLRNSNTTGPADIVFPFGAPGVPPIAADRNGDGVESR